MNKNTPKGILLIQLGTPDSPSTADCRRYLHEFLMDPRVIDIPWILRVLLVYGIIGIFRSPKTAAAYKTIWTKNGSPLRFYTESLKDKLQNTLGNSYFVALGMRYGNPSISAALEQMKKHQISEILMIPLYPQYASASYGSSVEKVFNLLRNETNIPAISLMPPFYGENFFIDSQAAIAQQFDLKKYDHFLMSFHGLPERQILRSADDTECLTNHCCHSDRVHPYCYRAQCYKTAELLSKKLALQKSDVTVCFQSRLGRTPWIQPFTDQVIVDLANAGKKNILVFCPSFTADCLETLEEITIRGQELFRQTGGETLTLVPSLNADDHWVEKLADSVRKS